jgi:hypothetical protein
LAKELTITPSPPSRSGPGHELRFTPSPKGASVSTPEYRLKGPPELALTHPSGATSRLLIPEGADTPTRVSRKILPGQTQNGLLAPPERRSSGSSCQGNRAAPLSDCQPSAVHQAVTVPSTVSVHISSDAAECTVGTGEKGVKLETGELNLGNFARRFKVSQSVSRLSISQFC